MTFVSHRLRHTVREQLLIAWTRLEGWSRRPDTQVLFALLAFVLVVRVASLGMPMNPDAMRKWGLARDILAGETLERRGFDHHAARWGVNLVVLGVQAVFGDGICLYYVPILLFDLLQAFFVFRIGQMLHGRSAGVIAVVWFSALPHMSYLGSQLMPSVFESAYVLGAVYFLLRAQLGPRRSNLVASALFAVAAYFAKETSVFFLPGLALGAWVLLGKFRYALLHPLSVVAAVGLETLMYRSWFGFALGRVTIIRRHHLGNPKLAKVVESLSDLLDRYAQLQTGLAVVFYAGLVACVVSLLWRKGWSQRRRARLLAVAASCFTFFLLNTFALKSLNPPRLAQPLNERYLVSAMPLMVLLATVIGLRLAREVWKGQRPILRPRTYVLSLAAVSIGFFLIRFPGVEQHPFSKLPRTRALVQAAFDEGLPLVCRDQKRHAVGALSQLFLTRGQTRRLRYAYPHLEGKKARVVVNGRSPDVRKKSKKQLNRRFSKVLGDEHVLIGMDRGFYARHENAKGRD